MTARRGATLIEVTMAGAIAVLLTLSFLEGVIVSTRIAHENSRLLAAEAFAWDTAWKWLNKPYEELNNSTTAKFYPDAGYSLVSSNACPMLCRELNGGSDAKVYVKVTLLSGSTAVPRHGTTSVVKRIDVDVEWGPANDRRCLNGLVSRAKNYKLPISVFKGPVDRGT